MGKGDMTAAEYRKKVGAKSGQRKPRALIVTESQHQIRLFQELIPRDLLPLCPDAIRIAAIPNGGYRSKRTAGRLKAEGLKAGLPDLFWAYQCRGYGGLFIEMKSINGRLSPAQEGWIDYLREAGYRVEVAWGADDALNLLMWYAGFMDEYPQRPK